MVRKTTRYGPYFVGLWKRESLKKLKSQKTTEIADSPNDFYYLYSKVRALCHEAEKDNEAVGLFLTSKLDLDRAIDSGDKNLANLHALQGLLHWLQPSYPEFDRMENAQAMQSHASAAVELSDGKQDCIDSYAIGLYVQLRISSFLMKSNLLDFGKLYETREKAHSFVEGVEYGPKLASDKDEMRHDLIGLVLDGLGFSYYQVEGDRMIALHYLSKGYDHLNIARHGLSGNDKSCRRQFVDAIIAIVLWDIGTCHESEAEQRESKQAVALFEKARASYVKALSASRFCPWNIYKALCAYGVAGTFLREHDLRTDLSKSERRELVSKAVSFGEEASSYLRSWSTLEMDILGGVANALFYQRMAEVCEEEQKRSCVERSLELISKAENAARRSEGSRFSDANYGDIYLRGAVYYYKMSSEVVEVPRKGELLETSLRNCELGQKHFDDERHQNRMVDSLLLGAKICLDLARLSTDEETPNKYRAKGREQCQKSISICRRNGWDLKVRESLELSANLEV